MRQELLKFTENSASGDDFASRLRDFNSLGVETEVEVIDGIQYYTNEYWTSRQRQAHRIHEISYRACFKPQLPRFFIERLTVPGDIIYDPFMGRGTTLLEAALLERTPYGNDVNPLSRALVEPRLAPPCPGKIERRLKQIPWNTFETYSQQELLTFYHSETLAKLEGLRNWLLKRHATDEWDGIDSWIRMVAINRLTGHSPGFFSVYTMPPNQAVTVERQKRINEKRKQQPTYRDVRHIILRKSKTLLSQPTRCCDTYLTCTGSSHSTPEIPSESVALTVTSPPFLDVVNYESDNWLRCWFLGIDPNSVQITCHRKIEAWQYFIQKTLKELSRITKPNGYIAFEVGEVRNGKIKLERNVIAASKELPLSTIGVMINRQEFTKTSNCWGVSNNKSGTNSNRIVILQKNDDT